MAAELERQAEAPNTDLIPAEERIEKLIEAEWDLRYQKKFSRYLKKASLRYPQADIDQSIYDADRRLDTESIEHLTGCKWIEEGRNLLITGPAGGGKTWASNAFCINALRQFKTVRYVKTSNILYEIEKIAKTIKFRFTPLRAISTLIQEFTIHAGNTGFSLRKIRTLKALAKFVC